MTSIPSSMTSMVRHVNAGSYSRTVRSAASSSGEKTQAVPPKTQQIETPVPRADETRLRALARKYSVAGADIIGLATTLSKEEQADFVRAADGAGNQLRNLMRTTKVLSYDHSPEERVQYLATAAKLDGSDCRNFIKTIENVPSSRKQLIFMVDRLEKSIGEDDLSNFLEAAEAADTHAREFIVQAQAFHGDPGMKVLEFSDYLMAAVKTGDAVSTFVDRADKLTTSGVTELTELVNEKLDDLGLSNFFTGTKGLQAETIATVIDLATHFSVRDRGNFLGALAQAGTHWDQFLSRVVELGEAPDAKENLSGFLDIMEKAEVKIGIAMAHFDAMDQGFAAGLSTVDMANYLDLVQGHGENLERIETLAGQLSGEDRSLFLYAAVRSKDIQGLVEEVETLDGEERTAFLVEMANNGIGDDAFIYVKGLLGEEGYRNFQIAGDLLHDESREILMEMVENQDAGSRTRFLQLAVGSGESARGVVNLVSTLSKQDQETFLAMTQALDRNQQGKWIKAMDKGQDQASGILSLARTRGGPARNALVKSVSGAKTKDLEAFLDIFDYMGRQEQTFFLKAADEVGTEVGNLVEQSHKLLANEGRGNWSVPGVYAYSEADFKEAVGMPHRFLGCLEAVDMMRGPMIASYIHCVI